MADQGLNKVLKVIQVWWLRSEIWLTTFLFIWTQELSILSQIKSKESLNIVLLLIVNRLTIQVSNVPELESQKTLSISRL
jgi:hypothetical protein